MKSQDKRKPKLILGNLDLQVAFHFPGSQTIYRTITHPPKLTSPAYGARECLNLTTNRAERLECKREVRHAEHKLLNFQKILNKSK